jgi:hypothetical protein
MKQTRNKIVSHQTECLECGHYWKPELIQSILYEQGKDSVNMQCFCGTRHRIIENVNGWIVFRRYIKRKDQIKRATKMLVAKKTYEVFIGDKLVTNEKDKNFIIETFLNKKNDNNTRSSAEQV